MKTAYKECSHCHTRLLIVRGVPPLNYAPDPLGQVAVTIDNPRRGRFLARAGAAGLLEHSYSVHECDGMKRAAQRGNWAAATSKHNRDQRRRRSRNQLRTAPDRPGQLRLMPPQEER